MGILRVRSFARAFLLGISVCVANSAPRDRPVEVACLTPSTAAWVLALGKDSKKIVAASDYSEGVRKELLVGSYRELQIEKLSKVLPQEFYFESSMNRGFQIEKLKTLFPSAKWIDLDASSLAQLEDLRLHLLRLFPNSNSSLIDQFIPPSLQRKTFFEKFKNTVRSTSRREISVVPLVGVRPFVSAGDETVIGTLLEAFGFRVVPNETHGYRTLSDQVFSSLQGGYVFAFAMSDPLQGVQFSRELEKYSLGKQLVVFSNHSDLLQFGPRWWKSVELFSDNLLTQLGVKK